MDRRLVILTAVYSALWVATPLMSTRIVGAGAFMIMAGMPVALVGYGLLDVLNQVWGAGAAKTAVASAVTVRAIIWSLLVLSGAPGAGEGLRIALAGEAQLLVSQYLVDIRVFGWARRRGWDFLARYGLSDLVSVPLSLGIFVVGSLWGTGKPILPVLLGGTLLRLGGMVLLAPVFTLGVRFLQSKEVVA